MSGIDSEEEDASPTIHVRIDRAAREIGVYGVYSHETLMNGYNVELEHGQSDKSTNVTAGDVLATVKIAVAHLEEFPDYYERLKVLESEDFWAVVTRGQQKKLKSNAIVTAPHSICPSTISEYRWCDLVSGRAAMQLTVKLTEFGHSVMIFLGNVHRATDSDGSDLDHAESRNSAFRKDLSIEMMNATKGVSRHSSFLIDVHSFPKELARDFVTESVVVVDPHDQYSEAPTSYVMDFVRLARRKKLSIGYVRGGSRNDIVIEAREKGMRAFVLEILESNSSLQDPGKLWDVVGEWGGNA